MLLMVTMKLLLLLIQVALFLTQNSTDWYVQCYNYAVITGTIYADSSW